MKRGLDILVSLLGLLVLWPFMLLIGAMIRLETPGPALHWSRRIGQDNIPFFMPKFRTMRTETPDMATHLLEMPEQWISPMGRILRRTSLDELPQLWSVLRGQMTLVGPRPALHTQQDLIELRTQAGIQRLRPGVTGWAQINGRDELPIPFKVQLDGEYLRRRSLIFDLEILVRTIGFTIAGRGVSH